jgi:hypothetical protein
VETATIDIPRDLRNANVRAYMAGGGATAALVAAAVVVFLGVAAFVGFNGLPFGADDAPDATVNLAAGVPEAAAGAAAPTADAVAADPATPSAAAIGEILAALPPGATGSIPGLAPGTTGPGGTIPNVPGVIPPGTGGGGEVPTTPGALGTTVGGLENMAGDLGLNLPLTDLTEGLTGPLDKTVTDTVNGLGGILGDPKLGDKVTGGLGKTTDGLLGEGGLTDSLLGKK